MCMSKATVNIDEQACAEVMRRYRLPTKRAAISFALRTVAAEAMSVDQARALRRIGWEDDRDHIRSGRLMKPFTSHQLSG